MRITARVGAALAVALLLASCGDDAAEESTATPSAEPTVTTPAEPTISEPEPTGTPAPEPTDQPPEVEAAIEDLVEHLGVEPADITVVSYEEVTWPDGSIGCPEPGMSYTQALVPGSRLVLEADGVEYAYHAGREPDLVRCDDPQPATNQTGTSPETT